MENTLKMIMKKQNQTALKEKIVVGGVVVNFFKSAHSLSVRG